MREPQRERDQLDLLIDSAISTYAEPPAGLEDRVLNVFNAERFASTRKSNQIKFPLRRMVPWAIAISAAACLLLVLFIYNYGVHRESQARKISPLPPPTVTTGPQAASARAPKVRSRRRAPAPVVAALPKLDVFPTPHPLAPLERALLDFAVHAPEPERKALAASQKQFDAPLSIAAINVPPLTLPDRGTN